MKKFFSNLPCIFIQVSIKGMLYGKLGKLIYSFVMIRTGYIHFFALIGWLMKDGLH